MAAADAFEWDLIVEVSIYSLLTLVLMDLVQNVFPRSFSAGESFLLSGLIIQSIRWVGTIPDVKEIREIIYKQSITLT